MISRSIDIIARLFRRSCVILVLKYFFISFNLEKLLSLDATVTGIVNAIRRAIAIFGKVVFKP